VTKLENASLKMDLSAQMSDLSVQDRLPRRPGYGTQGRKIVLWANYFKLEPTTLASTPLYRYSVAFQGTTPPKPKKKRTIELLLSKPPFAGITAATDGAQVIVTTQKVKITGRQDFKIEWYPKDGAPTPAPTADEPAGRAAARQRNTLRLLVEELGTVSVADLLRDISFHNGGGYYSLRLETIQALNILLGQGPSNNANIAVSGGNKYYPFQGHPEMIVHDLGNGLQALRGYFSSVRTGVRRIIVNVNVATGAFFQPGPLIELMKAFNNGQRPQNPEQYNRTAAFVRKLRVETQHLTELDANGKPKMGKDGRPLRKKKTYTIASLSRSNQDANSVTFDYTNAAGVVKNVTVATYYKLGTFPLFLISFLPRFARTL
jgi:hypothetical protein